MVILEVETCLLIRDRCDSSQHIQLHKMAGHPRIYSQNLFGEQSTVGTSSFQHLSFTAAAWEASWATHQQWDKTFLSFPKFQGRQHELQYNTSGQIWESMHANSTEYQRFTVKLRDSGGFLFRSYPFLFPEVKGYSVANDQKSVWKEKFTSLNIKHSQIFLSMCFVSSVHGTLVLTQALASDYVCLEYSISQRAGRNKQNTHQEIVLQKL